MPLTEAMKCLGITVWIDLERAGWGDDIVGEVSDGMADATYVLAIITRSFVEKGWPIRELNSAISLEITKKETKVLPVFAGSDKEIEALRDEFPLIHGQLFRRWEDNPDEIAKAVKELLDRAYRLSQLRIAADERSAITTDFWAGNYAEAAVGSQTRLELALANDEREAAALAFANLLLIARGRREFGYLVETMQRYFPLLPIRRLPDEYRFRIYKELFVYYYERDDFTRSALYLERMERIDPTLMAYTPSDEWMPGTIRWRKAHLEWLLEPTKRSLSNSIALSQEGYAYLEDVARSNPNTAGLASASLNLGWLYYLGGDQVSMDYLDLAIAKAAGFSPRTRIETEVTRALARAKFGAIPEEEALRRVADIRSTPEGERQPLRSYAFLGREPDTELIRKWLAALRGSKPIP